MVFYLPCTVMVHSCALLLPHGKTFSTIGIAPLAAAIIAAIWGNKNSLGSLSSGCDSGKAMVRATKHSSSIKTFMVAERRRGLPEGSEGNVKWSGNHVNTVWHLLSFRLTSLISSCQNSAKQEEVYL